MKEIEQKHIDLIHYKFAAMQSKEDLASLLTLASKLLYGKDSKSIRLRSITYYADPRLCQRRYKTFTIKKKSGGERTIQAPQRGLKSILRALNFVLQCIYEPEEAATGFVLNKSIIDNAKIHTNNHYVYNIDLKDFFHSFDRNRVKLGFMYEPFNLNKEREPLAFLLASLCTHPLEINGELKTVLPQGSPASPTITNILSKKLDKRLTGLSKRFHANYSRYADDITFSSQFSIFRKKDFLDELHRIIEKDQDLIINPKKTRLQSDDYKQEVTGLIVNQKVNVKKRYIKQLRMQLFFWEKYGYTKAEQIFIRDYSLDKGHIKKTKPNMVNVLDGKLQYLKMVKGVKDTTYLKLWNRFEKLTASINPASEILDIWEKEGVEKAMDLFYKNKI